MVIVNPAAQPNSNTFNPINPNGGGRSQNSTLMSRFVKNVTGKSFMYRSKPYLQCIPIVSIIVAPIFMIKTKILELKLKEIKEFFSLNGNHLIKKFESGLNFEKQMNWASLIPVIGNLYVLYMQYGRKSELDNK
jgi:hypothetical protein